MMVTKFQLSWNDQDIEILYRPTVKNNLPISIDPGEIIYHVSEMYETI